MSNDWKEMLNIIDNASDNSPEELPKYSYSLNESTEQYEVMDSSGNVVEQCPLEAEAESVCESLNEDGDDEPAKVYETFWDAYEVDTDFVVNESNDTFCVLGSDTDFHYGTHLTDDMADRHRQSLMDNK